MINHTLANDQPHTNTGATTWRMQPHGTNVHHGECTTTHGRMLNHTRANDPPHTGEGFTTHGRIPTTNGEWSNHMSDSHKPQLANVNNDDEPHTGMIGITFSISWYTFYDSPLISKKSKVAVWFWEHKKCPNLQSIVLGYKNFPGHGALRVAPEAPSPPILEKRAKVMEQNSRKLPKQHRVRRPITGKTP